MKRITVILLAVLFSILTVFLLFTAIQRSRWEYNENGVHFDEVSMTTYNDYTDVYIILTLLSLIPALVLIVKALKVSRNNEAIEIGSDQPS